MLHYPKIPSSRGCPGGRFIAFEKCDGTNLHWDWDRDFGWHAFGTRRDQFNLSPAGVESFVQAHPGLDDCVDVFRATLADSIERTLRDGDHYQQFSAFKVFTEFCGPNSFAGMHKADDPKRLVLFDVWAEPFGLIGPEQFVADFGHLPIARVVYRGKFTGQFAEDVRDGKYGVAEGVVCKGGAGGTDLWMAKIKTYAYLEKLKAAPGFSSEPYVGETCPRSEIRFPPNGDRRTAGAAGTLWRTEPWRDGRGLASRGAQNRPGGRRQAAHRPAAGVGPQVRRG